MKKSIVVSLESDSISVAEVMDNGPLKPVTITKYRRAGFCTDKFDTSNLLDTIVSNIIVSILRDMGIKRCDVVLSLPSRLMFDRFLKLAPVSCKSKSQLEEIIQVEAQQNVPFPINEVAWDYHMMGDCPSLSNPEKNVAIFSVKQDYISPLVDSLKNNGIRVKKVTQSVVGILNAIIERDRTLPNALPGCKMFLDIGADSTSVGFIEKSKTYFLRSIPFGLNAMAKDVASALGISLNQARDRLDKDFNIPKVIDESVSDDRRALYNVSMRLYAEVTRTINFYKGQCGGTQPLVLLICGLGANVPGVVEFFEDKTKISTSIFPYCATFNSEIIDNLDASVVHLAGVALGEFGRPNAISLNLKSVKVKKPFRFPDFKLPSFKKIACFKRKPTFHLGRRVTDFLIVFALFIYIFPNFNPVVLVGKGVNWGLSCVSKFIDTRSHNMNDRAKTDELILFFNSYIEYSLFGYRARSDFDLIEKKYGIKITKMEFNQKGDDSTTNQLATIHITGEVKKNSDNSFKDGISLLYLIEQRMKKDKAETTLEMREWEQKCTFSLTARTKLVFKD